MLTASPAACVELYSFLRGQLVPCSIGSALNHHTQGSHLGSQVVLFSYLVNSWKTLVLCPMWVTDSRKLPQRHILLRLHGFFFFFQVEGSNYKFLG